MIPTPSVVPDPVPGAVAQTSRVYAADGSLIATFHSEHNRELIDLSEMPLHLQQAAIATEDARFYKHGGLDLKAIARALIADIKARDVVQGGSTITQQYVKNAYIEAPKKTIFRKLREALLASQVERVYSKSKILENYLNTLYLGKGAYGVQAAAKTYFGKPAKDLTLSESALLVGLIPGPVRYSPYDNPSGAEIRRQFVIERMEEVGFIDAAAANAAAGEKPVLAPPQVEVFRFPWFVDAVRRDLNKRYKEAVIYRGGLNIHTTVDPKMQEHAERVVAETLNKGDDPYASIVSIDPKTGYVKALVGGRDYNVEKFNLATQAKRQPGSSFKPFVLVAALEKGIKAGSTYSAPAALCPKGWPKGKDDCPVNNYGNTGYGRVTVEKATINSINTAYAQMIVDVTPKKIVEVAHRMGIKTELNPVHALGLGSGEVTPLEMASAYATLADNGAYRAPRLVSKITDSSNRVMVDLNGRVDNGPSDPVQAIDPNIAAKVNEILAKVITSGTGKRADIGRPAAGKTGTATAFKNAWFTGYTPDLSTAVWMGYRSENKSMTSVHGVRNVAGGTLPAQMWGDYMEVAVAEFAPSEFPKGGEIRIRTEEGEEGFGLPPRAGPRSSPAPEKIPEDEPSPVSSPSPRPSPSPTRGGGGDDDDPDPIPTVFP